MADSPGSGWPTSTARSGRASTPARRLAGREPDARAARPAPDVPPARGGVTGRRPDALRVPPARGRGVGSWPAAGLGPSPGCSAAGVISGSVPPQTIPTPAAARMLAIAAAIRPVPRIRTYAARRRARARAPASPSWRASETVASSPASRARSGCGRTRKVPVGKSSSAPPAASRVSTRSAVSAGTPCSAAA